MKVSEAIRSRRAIKHYDPAYQIPEEEFKSLMEVVMQSPSSFNIQHWRFVDVIDKDMRHKIREAAWGQAQVTDASKLLVLCADVKAWEKDAKQYWQNAPEEVISMMVPMIKDFYDGREWIQRDEALRSVGIVAQSFMLSALEKGYDTCPMIGFDQDAVGKIINLPEDHIIGMMLVIGKRSKDPFPRGGTVDYDHVVIQNKF